MLRSLYTGVSGLQNHQMKMDVIGNNIANINTIGFKASRINFGDALSQSMQGTGRTFRNPLQVGLGMKTNSIDNLFTQGNLERTGNVTDLAIEGEGFFILKSEGKSFFTRSGAFHFDASGRLVNHNGFPVQGWMLSDANTENGFYDTNLSDVVLDTERLSRAVATENAYLTGNLNAGLQTVPEVWTAASDYIEKAVVQGSGAAPAYPVNIAAGVNDQLVVEISGNNMATISQELTMTAGAYADADAFVAELNTQIQGNSRLNGRVEAVNNGGTIEFRQLSGNAGTQISILDGSTTALATLGFVDGDGDTAVLATTGTDLNDTLLVSNFSTSLVDGDTIQITGTNPDGSYVLGTFTYGAANDGTTINDLMTRIQGLYTDVTVSFADGKIVLTDDVAGNSETTIHLSNGATNSGNINLPGFSNTTPGVTGMASTSVVVYDSLGTAHNLVIEFTKTETDGEWTWQALTSNEEVVLEGGSGRLTFNQAGELVSFTYDNAATGLRINPGNGADELFINLHAQADDDYAGLSQYDSLSTVLFREQDGRATGHLVGIEIDKYGNLSGSFSNGDNQVLAKLGIGQFSNNNGLTVLGDGLFEGSMTSGDVHIVNPEEDLTVSIASGALEMSNVDLSKEFTEMITTQKGFQASAKVITTADQLLNELINLKR